jgi:hypothetical protein
VWSTVHGQNRDLAPVLHRKNLIAHFNSIRSFNVVADNINANFHHPGFQVRSAQKNNPDRRLRGCNVGNDNIAASLRYWGLPETLTQTNRNSLSMPSIGLAAMVLRSSQ